MIGGMSGVENDIIPYGNYNGIRSNLRGLNNIGLKRKGVKTNNIKIIHQVYKILFDKNYTILKNIEKIKKLKFKLSEVNQIIKFITEKSKRGICTP